MTQFLQFPVIALGPGGVDLYHSEIELTTCHRRSVRSVYRDLTLVDAELDCVQVRGYRTNNLPPRRTPEGKLLVNQVKLELQLSDPERVSMKALCDLVLEHGGPSLRGASTFREAVARLEAAE